MRNFIKTIIPAVIAVFITACGGSDNNSKDNDQDNKALSYQGITDPVILTEENKEKVASELIKFIKQYSVYRDFLGKTYFLQSRFKPFHCENESASETKFSYVGNQNEIELYTHKYDKCLSRDSHISDPVVVSGEGTLAKSEEMSLVSDVLSRKYEVNIRDNFDVDIRYFPGMLKVITSIYSYDLNLDYSGLDDVKYDDVAYKRLNSEKMSFSNLFYRVETSYINESVGYLDESSYYTVEVFFKFNGEETVKIKEASLDYEYSGLSGGLDFDFYSIGLPSIGVLSGYTSGDVEVCSDGSDLGYDSAYKNDFSSGSMDVISGDKKLTIVYVGCGEYSVTLGNVK